MAKKKKLERWLQSGLTGKCHEGIFWGEGNIPCIDMGVIHKYKHFSCKKKLWAYYNPVNEFHIHVFEEKTIYSEIKKIRLILWIGRRINRWIWFFKPCSEV